ncbi:hypothetical protein [Thiomonas sp. FB-6]|uniref:hypothetical protein n=1 Tax=Thiomonas sp. FB-6 TaxID=1158291 RepID=UPI0035108055
MPDAVIHVGGQVQGVFDAKYKSLHPSASAPNGPQREDLYQMAAHLGRFVPSGRRVSWGVPRLRRQHRRFRYARGRRSAGVEGHITYRRQSLEHERPDRVRRGGSRRGTTTRQRRSRSSS